MAPDPSVHPKLTWKAWLRDALRTFALPVGVLLVLGTLGYGLLWLDSVMNPGGVRRENTELAIANIHHALKLYSAKTGRVPTTEEGIQALVDSGLLEVFPHDSWGMPYQYELRDGRPVVWSYGADAAPGGEGVGEDIFSREPK
jgi:general secretion pathway protein G